MRARAREGEGDCARPLTTRAKTSPFHFSTSSSPQKRTATVFFQAWVAPGRFLATRTTAHVSSPCRKHVMHSCAHWERQLHHTNPAHTRPCVCTPHKTLTRHTGSPGRSASPTKLGALPRLVRMMVLLALIVFARLMASSAEVLCASEDECLYPRQRPSHRARIPSVTLQSSSGLQPR